HEAALPLRDTGRSGSEPRPLHRGPAIAARTIGGRNLMKTIVAAGHICIDLIPNFGRRAETFAELLQPGALVYTGNMAVSPGGSAANVGMALARLGAEVNIIARAGNDPLGDL